MKWPSDILQNLPYIWNYIKQHSFFPFFISSYFIFYLVSAFTFQKYGKFWSVSQGQFSEHKPYFWRRVIYALYDIFLLFLESIFLLLFYTWKDFLWQGLVAHILPGLHRTEWLFATELLRKIAAAPAGHMAPNKNCNINWILKNKKTRTALSIEF